MIISWCPYNHNLNFVHIDRINLSPVLKHKKTIISHPWLAVDMG